MESPKSRSTDFSEMLDAMWRQHTQRAESEALAAGFATVVEYQAHAAKLDALRAEAEAAHERQRRVERILAQVGPRITDDVAARIRAGAGLTDTAAHVVVTAWLATDTPALIVSGGTGSGKTVAAIRAMEQHTRPQFLRALRIGAHFERWSADREDGTEPIDFHADLIVIDDLGQEPTEDRRAMPALEEVLDQRQSARTRTLITTNLNADQIRDRYSERIRSRLAQIGSFRALSAADMRRRRA